MNRIVYILLVLVLFSCKKKEIGPQCPTCETEVEVNTKEVLISCEGNFGWGNASLTLYNTDGKTNVNNVFSAINGYSLGDVSQSMQEIDGDLFVVVNNSGKIEILDTTTYLVKSTITGLTSPRYIEKVAENKAYVTDLFSDNISIVDLQSNVVSGTVAVGGWTENIVSSNEKVFVSRADTNWVFVINSATDIIEDTIFLSKNPSGIVLDNNNDVWTLCSGGSSELAALYQINTGDNTIIGSMVFPNNSDSPSRLSINSNGDKLFYLDGGIYQMSITDNNLPVVPLIENAGAVFYGFGVDPHNEDIYVADALDYVQAGIVHRYDDNGNSIDQFSVGIIPQAFWFK